MGQLLCWQILVRMLRDGVGTEPDVEQARLYFEASAKLGNPHAQYALAKMIIETGGSGNQFAQYSLGKLYCSREHMEKDIPKAIKLLSFTTIQTGHNMI